jgi:tetratricopeptide (TPR) repeat protein
LLVSLVFGSWFIKDYIQNTREQVKTAEYNVYIQQYDAAINSYNDLKPHPVRLWLLRQFNPPKEIEKELAIVESLNLAYSQNTDSLLCADSLMFTDNYSHALKTYENTIMRQQEYKKLVLDNPVSLKGNLTAARVDTTLINRQLELLEKRKDNAFQTLIREFKISQRDYEVFQEAKVWGQALRNLERMHELLPQDLDDQQSLQDVLRVETPLGKYVATKIADCRRRIYGGQ